MSEYLYLIRSESGLVKIGISNDPEQRLAKLNTASPEPLVLHVTIECKSLEAARQLEAMLHNQYAHYRTNGEWFNVELGKVIGNIERALKIASAINGVSYYENVIERKSRHSRHRRITKPMRDPSMATRARTTVWAHLEQNPHDATMNVRELAAQLGVGRTTVSEVQREFKEHLKAQE